jgi:hypothetical protein
LAVSALFDEQPSELDRPGILRRQILHLDHDVHLHPAFAAKDLLAPRNLRWGYHDFVVKSAEAYGLHHRPA